MVDRINKFIETLNSTQWITIVGILIAAVIAITFGLLNYLPARRERKLRTHETTPEVKAKINETRYEDGWRSVQLRIAVPAEEQNLRNANWFIERVRVMRPWWGAILARAENDHYANGVFYPNNPGRALAGKAEGRPQRDVLEFFIKFKGIDRGKAAKFKVTFSHIKKHRRHTTRIWAIVPRDSE